MKTRTVNRYNGTENVKMLTNQFSSRCEIRAYKPHYGLSRETTAFTGTLYVDGKRTASIYNEGSGGPNVVEAIHNRAKEWVFGALVEEHPGITDTYGHLDMSEDLALGLLVEYADLLKFHRTQSKKGRNTLMRPVGEDRGRWLVFTGNANWCERYVRDCKKGEWELYIYHPREKGGHSEYISTRRIRCDAPAGRQSGDAGGD